MVHARDDAKFKLDENNDIRDDISDIGKSLDLASTLFIILLRFSYTCHYPEHRIRKSRRVTTIKKGFY